MIEENELFDRAVNAYYRRCQREGRVYNQPARHSTVIDDEGNLIQLRNCNGRLATYRIIPTEEGFRLEWVDDLYALIGDPDKE
jgi:hypothetical protein